MDIICFQSYGLQANVALLVLLHRKGELTPLFGFWLKWDYHGNSAVFCAYCMLLLPGTKLAHLLPSPVLLAIACWG